MIESIKYFGKKLLGFIVETLKKLTLLSTLISVAVCLVLFFICFFKGYHVSAMLSLAGMICFLYVNKQF